MFGRVSDVCCSFTVVDLAVLRCCGDFHAAARICVCNSMNIWYMLGTTVCNLWVFNVGVDVGY